MKEMRFQAALRALKGPELAALAGCLARDCEENGITGELLGLCLHEALERARNDGRGLEVPATSGGGDAL